MWVSSMCWMRCPRLLKVRPQELNLQTLSMNTAIAARGCRCNWLQGVASWLLHPQRRADNARVSERERERRRERVRESQARADYTNGRQARNK